MAKPRVVHFPATVLRLDQPLARPLFSSPTLEDFLPEVNEAGGAALARRAAALEQQRRDDERVATAAQQVPRLDDPLGRVNVEQLITDFGTGRDQTLQHLIGLLLAQVADQSSLTEVSTVLGSVVGQSVDFNTTRASTLLTSLHELKFLQEVSKQLSLDEPVRTRMLARHIDREWGPRPVEGRTVKVEVPNPTTGANSKPVAPRAPAERASGEAKPAAGVPRSGSRSVGFNPFGNI